MSSMKVVGKVEEVSKQQGCKCKLMSIIAPNTQELEQDQRVKIQEPFFPGGH